MPTSKHGQDLYIKIIRELGSPGTGTLQWNIRETYAKIAERLGVDEETVRKRIRRAEKEGHVQAWHVVLNPNFIGRKAANIELEIDDEETKPAVISQLKLVEGVVFIVDFHGRGLETALYYQSEQQLERTRQLLARICGFENPTSWNLSSFPPANIELSRTDWQIIKALSKDPRRSLLDVAREIQASTRTVKRRLDRITRANVFFLVGLPDFRKAPGVSGNFLIYSPDEKTKRLIDKSILSGIERIAWVNTGSPNYSEFVVARNNISEIEDVHKWIKKLDGVEIVRMGIMRGLILVQEWLDEEIQKRINKN